MPSDRRSFLKSLLGAGTLAALPVPLNAEPLTEAHPDAMGVLVDSTYCVGCRKCEWACSCENLESERRIEDYPSAAEIVEKRRPDEKSLTVVNAWSHNGDREHADNLKVQCMHCIEPACVSACIVGALTKDPLGPVNYDAGKCIGCRYCLVACPFQIPAYEYHEALTPRVMKCCLCIQRTKVGKRPACVEVCPEGCLIYGRRDELLAYAHRRIEQNPERYHDHVYGEHEVGGTTWLYLSDRPLEQLGIPELGDTPPGHLTERVQHAIFKQFVPPLVLFGLLGGVMYMSHQKDAGNE